VTVLPGLEHASRQPGSVVVAWWAVTGPEALTAKEKK
jgi:hypothetical protein